MTHTADRDYPWQLSGAPAWTVQRPRARASDWERTFSRLVTASDFLVVFLATVSTHLIWFGFNHVLLSTPGDFGVDYLAISIALIGAWMLALVVSGSRDSRILGTDSTEYRRVVNSTLLLFGAIGVFAAMTQTLSLIHI